MTLTNGTTNTEPPWTEPRLDVSSGHARVLASHGFRWSLEGPSGIRTGNATGNLTLGFLEPATSYQLTTDLPGLEGRRFVTLASAWRWADDAQLRPGAPIKVDPGGFCTLGFFLRDATNETIYAATAGHCVHAGIGSGVHLVEPGPLPGTDPRTFGHVVAAEFVESSEDWALIEIIPEWRNNATPAIHSMGGPAGLASADALAAGHVVCAATTGTLGYSDTTRARCGYLVDRDTTTHDYHAALAIGPGDSGSPVILRPSGEVLGLITSGVAAAALTPVAGVHDSCHILARMQAHGYELKILTAPLQTWPPGVEVVPGPPVTPGECAYTPPDASSRIAW